MLCHAKKLNGHRRSLPLRCGAHGQSERRKPHVLLPWLNLSLPQTSLGGFRWTCRQARFRLLAVLSTVSAVVIELLGSTVAFTRSQAIITFFIPFRGGRCADGLANCDQSLRAVVVRKGSTVSGSVLEALLCARLSETACLSCVAVSAWWQCTSTLTCCNFEE